MPGQLLEILQLRLLVVRVSVQMKVAGSQTPFRMTLVFGSQALNDVARIRASPIERRLIYPRARLARTHYRSNVCLIGHTA